MLQIIITKNIKNKNRFIINILSSFSNFLSLKFVIIRLEIMPTISWISFIIIRILANNIITIANHTSNCIIVSIEWQTMRHTGDHSIPRSYRNRTLLCKTFLPCVCTRTFCWLYVPSLRFDDLIVVQL